MIEEKIIVPFINTIEFNDNIVELNIIKDLIPNSVLQMINAGNSEEAIKALNCNIDTNDNIFQVITKNLRDNIIKKRWFPSYFYKPLISPESLNSFIYNLMRPFNDEDKVLC